MRKRKQLSLFILIFVLTSVALEAQEDVSLHLIVTELKSASPPRILNDVILLTYKPNHPVRFVGAAFSYENYARVHAYQYNENGVYFLTIPIPRAQTVQYRIIIDGLWMSDPSNTTTVRDKTGIPLSVLPVPERFTRDTDPGITIQKDGRVRFIFQGEPDRNVSIAGDFNNWDPFMYSLEEFIPGSYAITIRMKPGMYRYYFFYDGNRIPDPWNASRSVLPDGIEVSFFQVPPS